MLDSSYVSHIISTSHLPCELKSEDSFILVFIRSLIKQWLWGWEVPTEVTWLTDKKDVTPGPTAELPAHLRFPSEFSSQIPFPIWRKNYVLLAVIFPLSPFLFLLWNRIHSQHKGVSGTWRTLMGFRDGDAWGLTKQVAFLQERPIFRARWELVGLPAQPCHFRDKETESWEVKRSPVSPGDCQWKWFKRIC